ncbi:MAG: restriction endonuclease [Sulfuritalea sp.]|nr:restriction endonuclease [Sulfuritalea sp.]
MAEKLPPHFVELVQDALLKSYWRRKAFRNVLRRNSVAEKFLATWAEDESKRTLLDRLFPALECAEKGPAVIKQLAVHLADQVSFPDLTGWPDEAEKIAAAKTAVAALKAYIDRERSSAEVARARQAIREEAGRQRAEKLASQQDLAKLQSRVADLHLKIGTQDSGYAFEDWFFDLVQFFDLEHRRPYKTSGRQIDGSITHEGTTYLVELKFTNAQTGAPDIDTFFAKVSSKADNTMGVFVSMAGFSSTAISEASKPKTPILLLDASHVFLVLQGLWELPELISRLRQHASQTSEAYLAATQLSR